MQVREAALAARSVERRFYLVTTLAMLLTVVVGFSRSFFLRPLFPDWPSPAEPIFYVHGTLFAGWCVLLVVQAALVSTGRTPLHRRLGALGGVLAIAMVASGLYASLVAAGRPGGFTGVPVPPLEFLTVPFFDILLFAAFVTVAIAKRRNPQTHKRWVLLATVNLLAAAIARWPVVINSLNPFVFFGLTDLFIVALVAWDWKTLGRVHRATMTGGLLLVASQPLRLAIGSTEAWLAAAAWAVGLVR